MGTTEKRTHANRRGEAWKISLIYLAILLMLLSVSCCVPALAQTPSPTTRQTATVSGVRKVLRSTTMSGCRYSGIHDFDVYFSLRIRDQAYCADYETVVLDEILDLAASEGRELDITMDAKRNKVILYTPQDRKLKALIVRAKLCKSPKVSYSALH